MIPSPVPAARPDAFSDPTPAADALSPLIALTAHGIEQTNTLLEKHLQSHAPLVPLLGGHLMQAGGKRIRPMLLLACAGLCGYEGEHDITLAAAVECIHTATLLHDDVVDESDQRRGRDTANALWGNKASVLVGDYLFSRAFTLMVDTGDMAILGVLAKASNVIAEGEVLQLAAQGNITTTEEQYMAVIRAKTAALFAAACRIGGMLAGRSDAQCAALEHFGECTGIAFQLADDALDYSSAVSGKAAGNDLAQGKMTLPLMLAYRQASEEEKQFWRRCIEQPDANTQRLQQALALMQRHNTIEATRARAEEYAAKARTALSGFADSRWRSALLDMVDFIPARQQ